MLSRMSRWRKYLLFGLPLEVWCCGMLVTFGGDDGRSEPFEACAGEGFRAKPPRSDLANHEARPVDDHQDRTSLQRDLVCLHYRDVEVFIPLSQLFRRALLLTHPQSVSHAKHTPPA
jgi:hypothetical protein